MKGFSISVDNSTKTDDGERQCDKKRNQCGTHNRYVVSDLDWIKTIVCVYKCSITSDRSPRICSSQTKERSVRSFRMVTHMLQTLFIRKLLRSAPCTRIFLPYNLGNIILVAHQRTARDVVRVGLVESNKALVSAWTSL